MAVAAHLHDVHKTYQVGAIEVPAIRGVSLDIEAGTFLSLAGPSGSGSTTFLTTGDPARFAAQVERLLGTAVEATAAGV